MMERPDGCPLEFADIESWNEETARKAGLRRYFDDEIYDRVLYLFPRSWAPFIPEGFTVISLMGLPQDWNYEAYVKMDDPKFPGQCLICGVWIQYRGDSVVSGLVNSDTD